MRLDGAPFPYPDYLQDLVKRIEQQWQKPPLPGGTRFSKATVFFSILRDGTVEDYKVEVGSGVLSFDRSALDAVIKASPFPPLPPKFQGSRLGVHLDFED